MQNKSEKWIAIDWGTSNFRAYLLENDKVIDQISSNEGMKFVERKDFEKILIKNISNWLSTNEKIEILASGMVGAKQGWMEVPYAKAPCTVLKLNVGIPEVKNKKLKIYILSGVSQNTPEDVMRGEETQLAGYFMDNSNFSGSICLPGTHSKWVNVKNYEILNFNTYLTGELYEIVKDYSVLKHSLLTHEISEIKLIQGVDTILKNPNNFSNELFQLRAKDLLKNQSSIDSNSLLSGYFLGLELLGSKSYWYKKDVILIGSEFLNRCYWLCLNKEVNSIKSFTSEEMTLKGLNYFKNNLNLDKLMSS